MLSAPPGTPSGIVFRTKAGKDPRRSRLSPRQAIVHAMATNAEPVFARAYLTAMRSVPIDRKRLIEAVSRGSIDGALSAVDLLALPQALDDAFRGPILALMARRGKEALVGTLRHTAVQPVAKAEGDPVLATGELSFDLTNPYAIQAAQTQIGDLITNVGEQQIDTVRSAIAYSIENGIPPKQSAAFIGNVVGMRVDQASQYANYAEQMLQDGVPYGPLFDQRLAAYGDGLVKQRGLLIAKTETIRASTMGTLAGWDQAARNGLLDTSRTGKVWIDTNDDHVCDDCNDLASDPPVPIDQPFASGDDNPPAHPACRCDIGLAPLEPETQGALATAASDAEIADLEDRLDQARQDEQALNASQSTLWKQLQMSGKLGKGGALAFASGADTASEDALRAAWADLKQIGMQRTAARVLRQNLTAELRVAKAGAKGIGQRVTAEAAARKATEQAAREADAARAAEEARIAAEQARQEAARAEAARLQAEREAAQASQQMAALKAPDATRLGQSDPAVQRAYEAQQQEVGITGYAPTNVPGPDGSIDLTGEPVKLLFSENPGLRSLYDAWNTAETLSTPEFEQAVADLIGRTDFTFRGTVGGSSAEWKNAVAEELAQRSGLTYDRANGLIKSWAFSSTDTNPDSIALQAAVAEKFGITPSNFISDAVMRIEATNPANWADALTFDQRLADARLFVNAMYDSTQQWLRDQGLNELTLFRGEHDTYDEVIAWGDDLTKAIQQGKRGDVLMQDIGMNPASSWSWNGQTSKSFAIDGHVGLLYQATIPASRVLATPFTGIGCLPENEFVIIGSDAANNVTIEIVRLVDPGY